MPLSIGQLLNKPAVRNTAIGVGVAVAVPVAVAALAPYLRPAARSVVKAGLLVFERGREVTAELGESMDDLVAEVREELRDQHVAAAATMADAETGTAQSAASQAANATAEAAEAASKTAASAAKSAADVAEDLRRSSG